jgi:PAS domain S-box-containing protein
MNAPCLRDLDAIWGAINQHSIVSMTDPAGTITFVNDTFTRISGYSHDELMGQNHRMLKTDVQDAEFWAAMWKTIASGYVWQGVVCNRAKDGSRYWVQTQISPFFDSLGQIEKYVSIRTDITAHRRALDELEIAKSLQASIQALRQRKFYLRAALDNLPFQFWLKDVHGCYLVANQVLADACGYQFAEELTGLTDFDLWPAAVARHYQRTDTQVMHSRQPHTREEPLHHAANGDGTEQDRWVEVFVKPLLAGDGEVVGTVGYARDITERKQAQKQLQEYTEHLNTVLELSPDGFVSFDAQRRVSNISPAFTRMSGISLMQGLGLEEEAFCGLLSRQCTAQCHTLGFERLRQRAADNPFDHAERIELCVGGKRTVEVSLRNSKSSGTASQILYFHDVTHQTELEQLKADFLTTAAHELRTPMASIYGYAELLQARELDAPSHSACVGSILRASELMVSTLNEMLDLVRIDERQGKDFVFESVSAQSVVRAAVSAFKLPQGRLPPTLVDTDDALTIMADPKKAHQALMHVLTNAYKYSPAGGDVQIAVLPNPSDAPADNLVGIRVTDNGIGMKPEQLDRVFERFYRADNSGKILGTGLGMSIVNEIVELHGGRVEIRSEPGVGTAVTLWLPSGMADTPLIH